MITVAQILAAIPNMIPAIHDLMILAEKAYGAASGSTKKAAVMQAIETMIGDSAVWADLKSLFSGIVNMLALFNFGASGKNPTPAPVVTPPTV